MTTIYKKKAYLTIPRIHAYLEQYKYANEGGKVLEVGVGAGVSGELLSHIVDKYETVDYDENLNPTIVADISEADSLASFKDKYDTIYCCQVLEHLPYEKFMVSLKNLASIGAYRIVVSIPDNRKHFRFKLFLPKMKFEKVFSVPGTGRDVNIENHKEHYWEINSNNYKSIKSDLGSLEGYKLVKDYRLFERPYQHFFILEKSI